MTREQIVADLDTLVLRIANELPPIEPARVGQDDRRAAEWAYVKGIACGEIMRLRDRLIATMV